MHFCLSKDANRRKNNHSFDCIKGSSCLWIQFIFFQSVFLTKRCLNLTSDFLQTKNSYRNVHFLNSENLLFVSKVWVFQVMVFSGWAFQGSKPKGPPTKFFGTLRNCDTSLPYWGFLDTIVFKTPKTPAMFFGTVIQKCSTQNLIPALNLPKSFENKVYEFLRYLSHANTMFWKRQNQKKLWKPSHFAKTQEISILIMPSYMTQDFPAYIFAWNFCYTPLLEKPKTPE